MPVAPKKFSPQDPSSPFKNNPKLDGYSCQAVDYFALVSDNSLKLKVIFHQWRLSMKSIKLFFVLICGSILFSGCASQYLVQFDSYPQGAALICNGNNWGYTPMSLYYNAEVKQLDTLDISDCSANWISGARKNYGNYILNSTKSN